MARYSTKITVGGHPVILSVPKNSKAFGKANCVFCPLGPAHSEAWLLVTKDIATQLQQQTTHDIVWIESGHLEDGSAYTNTLTFKNFKFIRAERVLQGGAGDDNALFLVEMADARYIAARTTDTGTIITNVLSYANNSTYLTGTSGGTWTSLVTALWTACGVLGAFPGLPGTLPIDGVPNSTWLIGLNSWRALCAVLDQLDCAVGYNPFTGSFTISQLGGAQTTSFSNNEPYLQWDGEPIESSIDVAANLRVYFYFHRKSYGQERDTELANNWALNGQGDIKLVATGVTGASGTLPLWDDLPWILDENNNHTNNADCVTRADNRKARYVTRMSVTPKHQVYSGLLNDYVPGGQIRAALWRNWGEAVGTVTEFICGSDLITGFASQDGGKLAWFDKSLGTPDRENYIAPDLGRRTYPSYPRLPNIVQVNASSGAAGDTVSPNADGFHKGRVRRWVANGMATLDDCWIRFVDEHDQNDGNVDAVQGDFFLGRLSGMSTSSGETLPVYLCRKGEASEAADQPIRFQLTSQLPTINDANAVRIEYNVATGLYVAAENIRVVTAWYHSSIPDLGPYSDAFVAPYGARGVAIYTFTDANGVRNFDIVWLERYARFIQVEAVEDYNDTGDIPYVMCRVLKYWDQGYPPTPGGDEQTPIKVYDPESMFRRSIVGAKGVAVYRPDTGTLGVVTPPRYDFLWIQQLALYYTAELSSDLRGDIGIPADINIQTVKPMTWSLYEIMEEPFPDQAGNPLGLSGAQGDKCVIVFNDTGGPAGMEFGQYQLLQVQQHPTWGWARLLGTLSSGGNAQARIWVDVGGTMTDSASIPGFVFTDITVEDRLLVSGSTLEEKTRIKWDYDKIAKKYYVTQAACSADESDTVWNQ